MFSEDSDSINRREFLSVMAASMALASLTGCAAAPPEKIVPYVRPPEELLPGKPIVFATSMPSPGYGIGLLVESHEGRPIRISGNPEHPASLGATDIFVQASLLTLYDPDRAQTVSQNGRISTWDGFVTSLGDSLSRIQSNRGAGLRVLTEPTASPTIADLLRQLATKYPASIWHQYQPMNLDNSRAGTQLAFGKYADVQYKFEDADVVVSLDSDFLSDQRGQLHYARKFASRRNVPPGDKSMNRLYVIESAMTITGAMADHRFPARSIDIPAIAHAISSGGSKPAWLPALLQDLEDHRGRSIVIAGETQPPEVHALTHMINSRLGNVGKTVFYIDPVEFNPAGNIDSLKQLTQDMSAGKVETLVILGGNPVYTAPADLNLAGLLSQVPLRIHHSLYFDETAERCDWHIPESHYLESWGDVRAWDGTTSIIQPLIIPLYDSRTPHEMFAAILGDPSLSGYEIVRAYWQKQHTGSDFEEFWTESVRRGIVSDSTAKPIAVSPRGVGLQNETPAAADEKIEVVFRADPTVFDGRWANNSWLQELPKPITTLTWDNAALMSATTAARLNVRSTELIVIEAENREVEAAVLIAPGCADNSITLTLGYGRSRAGRVGTGRGFNAYALRTSSSQWIARDANIRKKGGFYELALTHGHHELNNRHIAQHSRIDEYGRHPELPREETKPPEPDVTLYPPMPNRIDYAWGMAIDLSRCIGCNACVIACQAENNIPTVGKGQVSNGREMHWLRIDTYLQPGLGNPNVYFEPMLCQHCENAPCELVCPVSATTHSAEGLNEMTYNRCVGTRYCSNNCPYKVRRFNFFQYTEWNVPQLKLLYNPDVTVRSRGVMEKCTYCVQRINRGRIHAEVEDRKIRDGEVVTACQSACPAAAIMFGDLNDRESGVSKWKAEPRNYGVLAELNTRPRTTYLAKLTNPNPGLAGAESAEKVE